jgi:hypothetical protein
VKVARVWVKLLRVIIAELSRVVLSKAWGDISRVSRIDRV